MPHNIRKMGLQELKLSTIGAASLREFAWDVSMREILMEEQKPNHQV